MLSFHHQVHVSLQVKPLLALQRAFLPDKLCVPLAFGIIKGLGKVVALNANECVALVLNLIANEINSERIESAACLPDSQAMNHSCG